MAAGQYSSDERFVIDGKGMTSLAIVTLALFVSQIGMAFTIPLIVQHFDVSNTIAGLAATLEIGGVALTCLLYAPYVPRFDARLVCRASIVALLVLNVATILSPNVDVFLVCRGLSGIIAGLINVTTSSLAGRTTKPEKSFSVLLGSLGALGISLSLVLPQAKNVGPLIGLEPLHTIYALYCIFLLIGLAFCTKLPSPPKLTPRGDETGAGKLKPLRELPLDAWLLLPGLGAISFGVGALGTFIVSLGTEQIGMTVETVGLVMMSGAIVRIGGPFLGSWASARYRAVTLAAIVLTADAVFGMLLSHSSTVVAFALLAPILTASSSIFFPVLLGTLSRLEPAGRLAGMHTIFAMGGGSLASLVGGAVSSKGDYSANGFVVAGGMLLAAILLYRGLRTADRQRFGAPATAPSSAPAE